MKNSHIKVLICFFFIHLTFTSNFLIIQSHAIETIINPGIGFAPEIDGKMDATIDEWINATKLNINLYTNGSSSDKGLPVNVWLLQNSSDLFISIQFDLVSHKPEEFVGLLISSDIINTTEGYNDGKIIQFSDLGGINQAYSYTDYNIQNEIFIIDSNINGTGAANLTGQTVIYEFKMPVNNTNYITENDIFLDYGEDYAFKVVYGENSSYPNSIIKSNIIIVHIQYPPALPVTPPGEIILLIITIIVFSVIGATYTFFVYKTVILKKKVERFKK